MLPRVSRATRADFLAVQHLLASYGSKLAITPAHFNKRDIALQARSDSGELIGFLWVGLMAQNSIGYMDKFCVARGFSRQGIGNLLAHAMKLELVKRGVKTVWGIIRQDEHHDKSGVNALKMAIGADPVPYTYVVADVAYALKELEMAGRHNG